MSSDKRQVTPDILGDLLGNAPKPAATKPEAPPVQEQSPMARSPQQKKAGVRKDVKAPKPNAAKQSKPQEAKSSSSEESDKSKVTLHLSADAISALDESFMELRRLCSPKYRTSISRSDIIEVAISMASEELKTRGAKSRLANKLVK